MEKLKIIPQEELAYEKGALKPVMKYFAKGLGTYN